MSLRILANHFTVVGSGRVQQQQGVAGGSDVHNHKFLAGLADDAGESLKNRDFLGAG